MKTNEGLKLGKWILDMLFSIKFSTIHSKNDADNSTRSENIPVQTLVYLVKALIAQILTFTQFSTVFCQFFFESTLFNAF